MHHQMGIRDARMNFLDTVNRQNVAGRLARKLVRTVRSTNRNRECITLGLTYKVCCLIDIGQQLLASHSAFCAMTILFVTHHGFQRTEHTEFCLNRHTNRMRKLDHFLRYFDVVLIAGNTLAIFHQRTIHHHRGKAGLNRRHTNCG